MSESKKPLTLRESVLTRVPELEGLADRARRDDSVVTYLAVELSHTLHRYEQAERRARNALANAGRQVKEQQGYLEAGYAPMPGWLEQATDSYSTEAAVMRTAADRAMEQAHVLRKLIEEQAEKAAETAARMEIQLNAQPRVPEFPRESEQEVQ